MGLVVLAARVVLAAVFLAAAAGKLLDRDGTRRAVVEFGGPRALAAPLAWLLPALEIAAAVALLFDATATAGALLALALLLVFSAAVVRALVRGEAPDCHCFGQISSKPASSRTLVRNALLAALALLVLLSGAGEGWGAIGPDAAPWVAAGVIVAAVGAIALWAVSEAMRAQGRVLVRLDRIETALVDAGLRLDGDGLVVHRHEPARPAPAFTAAGLNGDGELSLAGLLEDGRPLVLVFSSPACEPCRELAPDLAAWQREHGESVTIAVLADGDEPEVREEAARTGLRLVGLDPGREIADAYGAGATPGGVLVDPAAQTATAAVGGRDAIMSLLDAALDRAGAPVEGLDVGTPAPQLELRTLDGVPADLGGEVVLLFWSSGCGFCRSLREELAAWEAEPPAGAPALVVVAGDDEPELREERFAGPVVLDPIDAVAEAFDAHGTPTAVRLRDGLVDSPVAVGGPAVLALLGVSGAPS